MNLLFRCLLAIHLCGLVVMAGTTVVDYYTFKTFCSMTDVGDNRSQGMLTIMARYGNLVRTGAVMLIITGLAMLICKNDLWNEWWFRIKMALVILLVLNGMFVGNNLGLKFREAIQTYSPLSRKVIDIGAKLNRFYLLQLTIFLLIRQQSPHHPMAHSPHSDLHLS